MKIKKIKDLEPEYTYDIEVPEVHEYLLSNGCVSHNTSSLVLNFTESIEPLQKILVEREGTFNVKKLAPNVQLYRKFYKDVFEFDYAKLLIIAAIRQKFLDQSQSLNLYLKNPDSAYQLFEYIALANKLGLKSLYYSKTPKKGDSGEIEEPVCEGCAL